MQPRQTTESRTLALADSEGELLSSSQLESRLAALLDAPVQVKLTQNRRTFLSLKKPQGQPMLIRMHKRFQLGDPAMLRAVADFIERPDNAIARDSLHRQWDRLVLETGALESTKRAKNKPEGHFHNLAPYLEVLLEQYFADVERPTIAWGRRTRLPQRRSNIRLGSFDRERRHITIHANLDRPGVPTYVFSQIIYHELLHHKLGHQRLNGRRQMHTKEFRELEKAYPHHQQAELWIKQHLPYLLGHREWPS